MSDDSLRRYRGPTTGAVILVICSLVVTIMLGLAYTTWAVQSSQRRWCATLELLTRHPVPKPSDPAANPSREQAYLFYTDFLDLRRGFECSP